MSEARGAGALSLNARGAAGWLGVASWCRDERSRRESRCLRDGNADEPVSGGGLTGTPCAARPKEPRMGDEDIFFLIAVHKDIIKIGNKVMKTGRGYIRFFPLWNGSLDYFFISNLFACTPVFDMDLVISVEDTDIGKVYEFHHQREGCSIFQSSVTYITDEDKELVFR